ncbi:MAG TPA: heavy metal translocating P-type ATPase [Paludibaculum sp.]|jgi:Cd2+/Zn2+-exporting ATPase
MASLTNKTAQYRVHGMDCAEEVSLLRARLSRVAGVRDLRFDVIQARMDVEYSPSAVQPETIIQAVASVGMRCEPWQAVSTGGSFWQRRGRTLLAWVSGLALVGGMTVQAVHSGDLVRSLLAHEHGGHAESLGGLALFWIAMVAGSAALLPKAWASLRALRPDLNLLIVLSLIGSGLLDEWTEAATLSFLFALAGQLEAWSMGRAREAITRLFAVTPAEAAVVHGDHEHRTSLERVPAGSLVRVRAGERIPFDGVVERGVSQVNQALITGESVAVEKTSGGRVYAGTMNETGELDIRTSGPASDTTLARIIRMVGDSQARRAPSEQFVERFARYYTPAVFLLAFSVAVMPPLLRGGDWSHWFYQGMVILLISCPCALVISTPVSIVSALASAARNGVLIKGGAFLEEAARIRAVAVDAECVEAHPNAGRVVAALRRRGVERTVLFTGGTARVVREFAGAAGFDEALAGVSIAERDSHVRGLMKWPGHVALVGDAGREVQTGAGSLGISLGRRGADLARESADVVLMTSDLERVVFLLDHARRTLRVIKQNVGFALGMKALFLAAAMAGVATLWMAVAADMGATLMVTLNGLRLLRAREHPTE